MTPRNLSRHNKFECSVSEAVLPNSTTLYCDLCQIYSGNISSLQHFVTMPMFLTIQLSSNCINYAVFPSTMEVLGCWYSLKSLVQCCNHLFTVAINSGTYWIYIDDLRISVTEYSLQLVILYSPFLVAGFLVFLKSVPFLVTVIQKQMHHQVKLSQ